VTKAPPNHTLYQSIPDQSAPPSSCRSVVVLRRHRTVQTNPSRFSSWEDHFFLFSLYFPFAVVSRRPIGALSPGISHSVWFRLFFSPVFHVVVFLCCFALSVRLKGDRTSPVRQLPIGVRWKGGPGEGAVSGAATSACAGASAADVTDRPPMDSHWPITVKPFAFTCQYLPSQSFPIRYWANALPQLQSTHTYSSLLLIFTNTQSIFFLFLLHPHHMSFNN